MTSLWTEGVATAIPDTALVTDTAGVKTPSARVRLVPKRLCVPIITLAQRLHARKRFDTHQNQERPPQPRGQLSRRLLSAKLPEGIACKGAVCFEILACRREEALEERVGASLA